MRAELDAFNALPEAEARERLAACLDVPRWVDTVLGAGRTPTAARARGRGERRRVAHRRRARGGAGPASADRRARRRRPRRGALGPRAVGRRPRRRDVAARLAAGNRAYEERFDRVFLIRAAGRDAPEILGRARPPARQRRRDRARRDRRAAARDRAAAARTGGGLMATLTTHVLDTAGGRPAVGVHVALESRRRGRSARASPTPTARVARSGRSRWRRRLPAAVRHRGLRSATASTPRWSSRSPSRPTSTTTSRCCSARSATPPTVAADLRRSSSAPPGGRRRPRASGRVGVRDGLIVDGRRRTTSDGAARDRRPRPTTRCCCRAWSTPTSTSTSPAAPSGRASPARPGPRPPAASPRSSTCRSTASRRPPRSAALRGQAGGAREQVYVDVGFWGGAVPGNLDDLAPLHGAGVFGFKCFLLDSGVEEFPHLDAAGSQAAMAELARLDALLIVHAEDEDEIAAAPRDGVRTPASSPRGPRAPRRSRSTAVVEPPRPAAAGRTSSTSPAPTRCRAPRGPRRRRAASRVETCPHYLTFDAEESPTARPSSSAARRSVRPPTATLLWAGAGRRRHRPRRHRPLALHGRLKRRDTGDFGDAWGGIASLQLGLPAVWTEARRRGHALVDVVRWMAEAPADLVGLRRKGRHRGRRRRRPLRVRSRRGVHRSTPATAAPQEPRDAVRRAYALRHGPRRPGCAACPSTSTRAPGRLLRRGDGMTTTTSRGGLPGADRADDRPGRVHRGVRRAPARHDARHRRQPAAALGRHPAVGAGPAAVRVRRDLQPVRRRGRARRRQRPPRGRPRRRGRAVRRRRVADAHPRRRHAARAAARLLRLPPARADWTLRNDGDATATFHWIRKAYEPRRRRRRAGGVRDPRERRRAGADARHRRRLGHPAVRRPRRRPPRHARQHRQLRARRRRSRSRRPT